LVISNARKKDKIVTMKRRYPFRHHFMTSSLGCFNKKSKFRQILFKIVIDPEYSFPDEIFKQVQLDDMEEGKRKEMINMGFKKNNLLLHRRSDFNTITWEAIDGNNLGNA
jgi:hypothetical protein